MDIKIDTKKLIDSPYTEDNKGAFAFDDNELIDQLTQELKIALPSTFLVSGYRGVGKTSFVNRIAEQLKDDHVCAMMNMAKYDGYQLFVKRLVRELFIGYQKYTSLKTSIPEPLSSDFRLLYDRTFNDIANSHINQAKDETKAETEAKFDLKKLIIPILTTIIFTFNLGYDLIPYTILSLLLVIAGVAWTALTSWNLAVVKTNIKSITNEVSIKSLYDDEIAEHFLFEILRNLKDNGIKVIIGFDELDKHEALASITKIIDDLKPLLLSGYANFFIIAGQQLNYHYEEANLKENEVISSIFSKVIHIPFLRYATLRNFCLSLIEDPSLQKNEKVVAYMDSMILQSRRIPRRLVNLIRSELKWSDNSAQLVIDELYEEQHQSDSKLLNCLTSITDNTLPKIAKTDAQLDFFVAQVHVWILKMKEYGAAKFLMSEVMNLNSYKLSVPAHYQSQLWDLSNLLTDELMLNKILGFKHQDDIEDESYYFWTKKTVPKEENASIKNNSVEEDLVSDIIAGDDFIYDFAHLESLIRSICFELNPTDDFRHQTLKFLIGHLRSYGFFDNSRMRQEMIEEVIVARNSIVHGHAVGMEAKSMGQKAQFNLNRIKAEILEDYVFFISRSVLPSFEFKKEYNKFDFSAITDNQILLFDVKYRAKGWLSSSEIKDSILNFDRFSKATTYDPKYVLFCFIPMSKNDFKLYNLTHKILEEDFPELKDRVEVVALMENSSAGMGSAIRKVLEGILLEPRESQSRNYQYFTDEEIAQVDKIIEKEAKKEWPDSNDFDMQLNYEDTERKAINTLRALKNIDVSQQEFNDIVKKAKAEFPSKFYWQMQLLNRQVEAVQTIKRLEAPPLSKEEFEKITSIAKNLHPLDYEKQLNEFVRQKQAFMLLKDMRADDISPEIFDMIKINAEHNWANDYDMQRQTILNEIEILRAKGKN